MSIREYMNGSGDTMFVKEFISRSSSSKNVKPENLPKNANIYERVRNKQKEIENSVFIIEQRKRKLEELKNEASKKTKRYEILEKKELEIKIRELSDEIENIESGNALNELNNDAKRYLDAFQKQQFCRPLIQMDLEGNSSLQSNPQLSENTTLIFNEYLSNIENEVPKFDIPQQDVCPSCCEPLQVYQAYAIMICPKCGRETQFLDATAALLAYSDDYDYCSFSYKRINHFQEWLQSIQAKENLEIPEEILNKVMEQLWQQRIHNMEDITVHRIRDILKQLKERKYYEHVQLITCKITGRDPPRMTPEMEERIKVCFLAATQAFKRWCPSDRKNMVSYSYSLLKLCELLGYHEFTPYFLVLKGKEKLTRVESLWKKICEDLDWTYIPSVPS